VTARSGVVTAPNIGSIANPPDAEAVNPQIDHPLLTVSELIGVSEAVTSQLLGLGCQAMPVAGPRGPVLSVKPAHLPAMHTSADVPALLSSQGVKSATLRPELQTPVPLQESPAEHGSPSEQLAPAGVGAVVQPLGSEQMASRHTGAAGQTGDGPPRHLPALSQASFVVHARPSLHAIVGVGTFLQAAEPNEL